MKTTKFILSLMILTATSISMTSDKGFASAFKKAVKKTNHTDSIFRIASTIPVAQAIGIPVAESISIHDITSTVQATAQVVKPKSYISIDPALQKELRDIMKQYGTYDKTLIETSAIFIKNYEELQENRTAFTIDSTRRDELDLMPHLTSVHNHLSKTTQTAEIIAMTRDIKNIIDKIHG